MLTDESLPTREQAVSAVFLSLTMSDDDIRDTFRSHTFLSVLAYPGAYPGLS